MKNFYSVFLITMIVLFSCKEDKTPSNPSKDVTDQGRDTIDHGKDTSDQGKDTTFALLPSTVGSYWINSNVQTTPPPNPAPDETTRNTDSVVVTANGQYQGRQASTQITYVEGSANDTTYYNQNANELYSYSAGVETPFFSIPRGWLKLADYVATTWKPFPDTTTVNRPIKIQGFDAVLNGTVKATSKKSTTSQVTISKKSYTATEFTSTITIDMIINFEFMQIPIPLKFDIVSRLNLVKGLGIITSSNDGFQINFPVVGDYTQNGFQSTLLRFKINP